MLGSAVGCAGAHERPSSLDVAEYSVGCVPSRLANSANMSPRRRLTCEHDVYMKGI